MYGTTVHSPSSMGNSSKTLDEHDVSILRGLSSFIRKRESNLARKLAHTRKSEKRKLTQRFDTLYESLRQECFDLEDRIAELETQLEEAQKPEYPKISFSKLLTSSKPTSIFRVFLEPIAPTPPRKRRKAEVFQQFTPPKHRPSPPKPPPSPKLHNVHPPTHPDLPVKIPVSKTVFLNFHFERFLKHSHPEASAEWQVQSFAKLLSKKLLGKIHTNTPSFLSFVITHYGDDLFTFNPD